MKTSKLAPLVLASLLAAAFAQPALAQYRWLDANGKVHYGDSPPRDAKDVRSLNLRAAPAQTDDGAAYLPFEVRRAMERAPVVLYTSRDCQPCTTAVALLRDRGVPFNERTINSPDDFQELRRISGGLRLPYLTVGSQTQSGFEPGGWQALLDAAGYPKGSMLPRTFQWPAPQPLVPPAKPEGKSAEPAADGQAAQPPPAKR